MQVGSAIRKLRAQRKLTIQQLAEMTSLSVSLISQVERNQVSPSVVSLWKIANAFGVPVGYFFDSPSRENILVRKDQRKKLMFPSSNVVYELLSPYHNHNLEFLMIRIEPGQDTSDGTVAHAGQECGLVLQGRLEIQVGEEFYILEEGDSICFESSVPHRLRNFGKGPVLAVWVDSPPMF